MRRHKKVEDIIREAEVERLKAGLSETLDVLEHDTGETDDWPPSMLIHRMRILLLESGGRESGGHGPSEAGVSQTGNAESPVAAAEPAALVALIKEAVKEWQRQQVRTDWWCPECQHYCLVSGQSQERIRALERLLDLACERYAKDEVYIGDLTTRAEKAEARVRELEAGR